MVAVDLNHRSDGGDVARSVGGNRKLGVGNLVDRNLRPDEQAELVSALQRVRMERVVRTEHQTAKFARPADLPVARCVVDREAAAGSILVHPDAAEVEPLAVERQTPAAVDLDRAHTDVARVTLHCPCADSGDKRGVVEVWIGRRPELRLRNAELLRQGHRSSGCDSRLTDRQPSRTKAPCDGDRLSGSAEIAELDLPVDARGAARARQVGTYVDRGDVDPIDRSQVDLAQDPGVVPPTALRLPVVVGTGRRHVVDRATAVNPDDKAVGSASLDRGLGQSDLERLVGAAVASDLNPVEPNGGSEVDLFEAHYPSAIGSPWRKPKILSVPADRSEVGGHAVVAGIPRVWDYGRNPVGAAALLLPALCKAKVVRIEAPQPASVNQIATGRAIGVQRLRAGDRAARRRGSLGAGDRQQSCCQKRSEQRNQPGHDPSPGIGRLIE